MDIPIIVPTYHGYTKYCGPLLQSLEETWPGHPPVWFITDRGDVPHGQVVRVDSSSWVERLYLGLTAVRKDRPRFSYCFLVLEDLLPLRPLDLGQIQAVCAAAVRHRLNCVSFVTHGSFRPKLKVRIGGVTLYRTPKDYFYYSLLKPGLWNVSNLLRTCEIAMRRGLMDPWGFETVVTKGHYVSAYHWPSWPDGIFHMGWVDVRALHDVQKLSRRELAEMVGKEYLRQQYGKKFTVRKARAGLNGMAPVVKSLAHPLRLRLLKVLATCPLSPAEAARILGEEEGRVARHLFDLERGLLVTREHSSGGCFRLNSGQQRFYYYTVFLECSRRWGRMNAQVREDKKRAALHRAGRQYPPAARRLDLGFRKAREELRYMVRILKLLADTANCRILRLLENNPLPAHVVKDVIGFGAPSIDGKVARLLREGLVRTCTHAGTECLVLAGPHPKGSFFNTVVWALWQWEYWNPLLVRDRRKAALLWHT